MSVSRDVGIVVTATAKRGDRQPALPSCNTWPSNRPGSRRHDCGMRFQSHRMPRPQLSRRVGQEGTKVATSLLIGAPLGIGVLLAVGILMVAMSYLSQ
jgi:hypothetical protein